MIVEIIVLHLIIVLNLDVALEMVSMNSMIEEKLYTKQDLSNKLRVSITNRCNLACFFCHNEGQKRDLISTGQMTIDEIYKIVEAGLINGVNDWQIDN